MKEFRILLIDDDSDQEKLLKVAVNNFNKKFFVNDLKELEKNISEKTLKSNCFNLNVKKFNVSFLGNIF